MVLIFFGDFHLLLVLVGLLRQPRGDGETFFLQLFHYLRPFLI